jgi:predicted metal-binding membrane protein
MNAMPMLGAPSLGAAASFVGMWVVMMVAMMLPSLTPTLWRYRKAGLGGLTALVSVAYFCVWTVFGIAAFPVSIAVARAAPIALGLVVLAAGVLQLTAWKAHHLA